MYLLIFLKWMLFLSVATIMKAKLSAGVYTLKLDDNFYKVDNRAIHYTNTYKEFFVLSLCKCQQMCAKDSECYLFSGIPNVNGGLLCRLSKPRPFFNHFIYFVGGFYVFPSKIDGVSETLMDQDTLAHHIMEATDVTADKAKAVCNSTIGLRLGIYKTKDLFNKLQTMASNLGNNIWVDMSIQSDPPYGKWGDGTWVNETFPYNSFIGPSTSPSGSLAVYYSTSDKKLKSIPLSENKMFRVICQGNPFGI